MSDTQVSSFPNVLFDPMMARRQTAADIANQYAPQRNQLLLDEGRQQLDFAAQKNPLEIQMLRQQLGLDGSPGTAALDDIYRNGQPPAPTAPGSFEQKMGGSESGNDPSKVNKGGYSGQFQFGAARLADLGVYHPAEGEDLSKNEWKGTFSIPGFAVTNHDDFLKNAAAQHAVFGAHVADIDQAIAATPGADKLDPNGLRAVAHLGGVAGMQKFIATGGLYDPADANGTRLSTYYAKFAAGGAPALQQAFGSPHGPAGPLGGAGGGVAGRIPGAVTVAGPGAPTGPAPGYGPDGQPLAAGTWDASPVTAAPGAGPGVAVPAPAAPGAAPGAVAPAAAPATGVNAPQVQQAQELQRKATQIELEAAKYPNDPRVKAQAAAMVQDLRNRATVLMTADNYQEAFNSTGEHGQRNQLTGQFTVDPAQRTLRLPDGRVIDSQGKLLTTTSSDAQVEEDKKDAGRLSELRKETLETAQTAGTTSTMIANTERAMQEAEKGNLGPNAIAPERLRLVAIAKAWHLPLPAGVDESKLAAGQVTREQLAQMNGMLLKRMFPQRITNVDMATVGTALPNYGLDPAAIVANFDIYKQQAEYDQAKARDMLAYEHGHGSLKGWENDWYNKHGFASGPLDNLFNDVQHGGGSGAAAVSAQQPTTYQDGQTATGPKGERMIYRQGKWGPM